MLYYIKRIEKTPKATVITFTFPDGQAVDYESANIILDEFSKEYNKRIRSGGGA